jgi:hypothetical protein
MSRVHVPTVPVLLITVVCVPVIVITMQRIIMDKVGVSVIDVITTTTVHVGEIAVPSLVGVRRIIVCIGVVVLLVVMLKVLVQRVAVSRVAMCKRKGPAGLHQGHDHRHCPPSPHDIAARHAALGRTDLRCVGLLVRLLARVLAMPILLRLIGFVHRVPLAFEELEKRSGVGTDRLVTEPP